MKIRELEKFLVNKVTTVWIPKFQQGVQIDNGLTKRLTLNKVKFGDVCTGKLIIQIDHYFNGTIYSCNISNLSTDLISEYSFIYSIKKSKKQMICEFWNKIKSCFPKKKIEEKKFNPKKKARKAKK